MIGGLEWIVVGGTPGCVLHFFLRDVNENKEQDIWYLFHINFILPLFDSTIYSI